MPTTLRVDEELVDRLPLPLAQLYRRAHNAKNALERFHTGYYLWEASLKLLGSVAIVEYAALGDDDPQLAERLQNLARPAMGHWWEFVRRLRLAVDPRNRLAEGRQHALVEQPRRQVDVPVGDRDQVGRIVGQAVARSGRLITVLR